jgi:Predicted phosphatases
VRIFFDLDGTLIDSRERLYVLFKKMIPESLLSFDEYWNLKRSKINHRMILEKDHPNVNWESFENEWLSEIESLQMIDLDVLYFSAIEVLKKLSANNELYVLTARQNENILCYELEKLGISKFFKSVLLTEGKRSKGDLLKAFKGDFSKDILIGDTGYDVKTGKSLGMKTIVVTHGFLSEESLRGYEPDVIVNSLEEVIENI